MLEGCARIVCLGSLLGLCTKGGARQASTNIFTDSALWAGSVIESPCPSVCLSVPSGAVFLERSSSHHNFHTVRARDLKF